jgi:hypothetical protein
MCSLIAHVEDGKIVRVQGDPTIPTPRASPAGR